ncbi:MAG: hypothetical protein DIU71_04080 [Proteobacteria bacterium]|nr:MAG: hypothetical protein DIU71_04080 [Pseudomonadota bacterium]
MTDDLWTKRSTTAAGQEAGRVRSPDSTYWRLKAYLLAQAPAPRQLLRINALAQELGTSGTPVREALIRLATEKLVVYVPKKGFVAKTLSAAELHAMYFLNHTLLHAALEEARRGGVIRNQDQPGTASVAPSTGMKETDIAHVTAMLFLRLANEYGNEEIAAIICNLNDRLHHARVAESFALDGLQEELQTLGRLIDEDERSALVEMVRKYHERRISALEAIHRELLLLPFTNARPSP